MRKKYDKTGRRTSASRARKRFREAWAARHGSGPRAQSAANAAIREIEQRHDGDDVVLALDAARLAAGRAS